MSEQAQAILIGVLGSSAFCELVRYFIGKWKANDKVASKFDAVNQSMGEIKEELKSMKRNEIRLQLMVLMSDYPNKTDEIMLVAERYFSELGGDWYLTGFFKTWLEEHNIDKPSWLK